MRACHACGLPILHGIAGYAGRTCTCFTYYAPAPSAASRGAHPLRQLTEEDVRRIVREELAKVREAIESAADRISEAVDTETDALRRRKD